MGDGKGVIGSDHAGEQIEGRKSKLAKKTYGVTHRMVDYCSYGRTHIFGQMRNCAFIQCQISGLRDWRGLWIMTRLSCSRGRDVK